jgi:hypothetical protein
MSSTTVHEERLRQGDAALYSLRRAAKLAGLPYSEVVPLWRAAGIVRTVLGRELVVWGDVTAWVRGRPYAAPRRTFVPPPGVTKVELP